MKKGAMEISVNFLAMLILAIVVFGLSVTFIYKLFGSADDIGDITQSSLDRQIEDLSCAGEKVCIFKSSMNIEVDKWTAANTNGLRIHNVLPDEKIFKIEIALNKAYRKDNTRIQDPKLNILILEPEIPLKKNQITKKGFGISAARDAEKGTYIYRIKLTTADGLDYYTGQFTVNIL